MGIYEKYCLKFQSIQSRFFLHFLFSIYKMVDSMHIYKSLNITIETVIKNPEMLKFVPDHLNTKKMCRHAVRKLPYLLRYVPDQYKTQQMCDKSILENAGTLKFVHDCYKN